jgi:hypothetical protein
MASKVQLQGGGFQDAEGNPLADGFLLFQLSQDASVNNTTEITSGQKIKVVLDGNGNVSGTPTLWPNDLIVPANTFYIVSAYTENGQLVWGPNAQQVLSSPSPFNIGAWVPGSVNLASGLQGQLSVSQAVTYTTATGGSASALPSPPAGYVVISINGSLFKVPYFNL